MNENDLNLSEAQEPTNGEIAIEAVKQLGATSRLGADIVREVYTSEEQKRKTDKWIPYIVIIVVAAIFCFAQVYQSDNYKKMHQATLDFFSEYEFYYEEVTQESAEGGGNNIYFPGENAQYNEAPKEE